MLEIFPIFINFLKGGGKKTDIRYPHVAVDFYFEEYEHCLKPKINIQLGEKGTKQYQQLINNY